jgi:hypothetical protein
VDNGAADINGLEAALVLALSRLLIFRGGAVAALYKLGLVLGAGTVR